MSSLKNVIIGCSPLGGLYKPLKDGQLGADSIIQTAVSLGFHQFDTAPHYGCGLSEERLGLALLTVGDSKSKCNIWSKVGRIILPQPLRTIVNPDILRRVEFSNVPGEKSCIFPEASIERTPILDYSESGIRKSFEDSLMRLQVDKLHGLRLHDFDDDNRMHEIVFHGGIEELWRLRRLSLIEDVSIGVNSPETALRLIHLLQENNKQSLLCGAESMFDSILVANSWNLIDHPISCMELFSTCRQLNIKLHNAGIFATGLLVGGDRYKYEVIDESSPIYVKVSQWMKLSIKYNIPLPCIAIAFSLRQVDAIVVGVKESCEVTEFFAWLQQYDRESEQWPSLWQEAKSLNLIASYC